MKLCIGLNKVALVRGSRGRDVPNLGHAASIAIGAGADAVRIHQWPDARHCRLDDISGLAQLDEIVRGQAEFHVGGNPRQELIEAIASTEHVALFVATPFDKHRLTTERGLGGDENLATCVQRLAPRTRVSAFLDPVADDVRRVADQGVVAVELSCRDFVRAGAGSTRGLELERLTQAAEVARDLELEVHVAHDLAASHLSVLASEVRPELITVGHTFMADAMLMGIPSCFERYIEAVGRA